MTSSPLISPAQPREIELDFLRGIAILLVLDYHSPASILSLVFGPKNPGWSGVDIFFVLSGFLVGGLLIKEWRLRGHADGPRFLLRRAFKVWPQYYVFLAYLLIRHHATLYDLRGLLLNIQNYVGPFTQMWSLAVEEHAYLFLIAFFAIAARLRSTPRHVFFALSAICAIVLTLKLILTLQGFPTFAATHSRIDGILYGVILALLYHCAPDRFRRLQSLRWLWLLVVAAAILYFCFPPPTLWSIPVHWIFADAMGVALLLLLYRHADAHSIPYRLTARIGLYSYGIFLWHMSVYQFSDNIARHLPPQLAHAWQYAGPYLLGIAAGIIATEAIEFPTLRLRERLFPRRIDSPVGTPAIQEETQP
jgi:peptidoglycan/LPS O-acetylase OafA/YrhL